MQKEEDTEDDVDDGGIGVPRLHEEEKREREKNRRKPKMREGEKKETKIDCFCPYGVHFWPESSTTVSRTVIIIPQ